MSFHISSVEERKEAISVSNSSQIDCTSL